MSSDGRHNQPDAKAVAPDESHDSPSKKLVIVERIAGRSRVAIVLFVSVMVLVLASDLLIKWQAFEHVAGLPLRLDYQSNVEVLHPIGAEGELEWLQMPRADPDEPSSAIPRHDPIPLIPAIIDLRLTVNQGAVFGLGGGLRWLFVVVSVVAVGVVGYLFAKSPASAHVFHIALALILAGALGNLYDRLRFGVVRDMFHLFPTTNLWPYIWNLADASLMIGVGLVLLHSFFGQRHHVVDK